MTQTIMIAFVLALMNPFGCVAPATTHTPPTQPGPPTQTSAPTLTYGHVIHSRILWHAIERRRDVCIRQDVTYFRGAETPETNERVMACWPKTQARAVRRCAALQQIAQRPFNEAYSEKDFQARDIAVALQCNGDLDPSFDVAVSSERP